MHAGWEYFVSFQQAARDFAELSNTRLTMPVLAIGGEKANGEVLGEQMKLVATSATMVVLKSMTIFRPDGRYAFVCSSFTPELAVIDVASQEIIKRLPQASPFCPNIAVSPENDEVWITLKDAGKVQVYSAKPPFEQSALLDTGPITNHVNFVNNRNGKFALRGSTEPSWRFSLGVQSA
jgi:hypothetical protein